MSAAKYEKARSKLPSRRFIIEFKGGSTSIITTTDRGKAFGIAIAKGTATGLSFLEAKRQISSVSVHPEDKMKRGRKPGSKVKWGTRGEAGTVEAPPFDPVNFYEGARRSW